MRRTDLVSATTAMPPAAALLDASRRSRARAHWERIRLVGLLAFTHVLLGLVGRLIGIVGGADDLSGIGPVFASGLAGDAFDALEFAAPAALALAAVPARWYRSFGLWMLIGLVSLGTIALSISLAVERARGAVDGSFADLMAAAVAPGSLWLGHPFTAVLVVSSLSSLLLLGPVRRAAETAFSFEALIPPPRARVQSRTNRLMM